VGPQQTSRIWRQRQHGQFLGGHPPRLGSVIAGGGSYFVSGGGKDDQDVVAANHAVWIALDDLHDIQLPQVANRDSGFFACLTGRSNRQGLTGEHLAAGKSPAVCERRLRTTDEKDAIVAPDKDRDRQNG